MGRAGGGVEAMTNITRARPGWVAPLTCAGSARCAPGRLRTPGALAEAWDGTFSDARSTHLIPDPGRSDRPGTFTDACEALAYAREGRRRSP
ncbi:hypothetical protein YUWDRAFT_05476 [Streptomyces sp. AmelKG-D3]|nr:hypothetical protein YUWDRAFT_05476 [Streptomyces sp. AmelKG-D3]